MPPSVRNAISPEFGILLGSGRPIYAGYLIQADEAGSPAIINRHELFRTLSYFFSVFDAVVPWRGSCCTVSIYDGAGAAVS